MKSIPIVETSQADPPVAWLRSIERLSSQLLQERPELSLAEPFRDLVTSTLDDAPTLLIDDMSEIKRLDGGRDARFYEDRGRLRAGDGDVVASCADPVPQLEEYCRDYLGLGSVQWLRPGLPQVPLRLAEACWEDSETRRTLLDRLQRDQLRYIHPHMAIFSVWELAFLLHHETRRPISVIGPPPGVTRWVNDKIAFANLIKRLFGPELVPASETASNLAYLSKRVRDLADQSATLGIKLPCAGGGDGNLVIGARQYRGRPLEEIHASLKEQLRAIAWDGSSEVLIDCWESEVICSPSTQLWIPPNWENPPVVEGVFLQSTLGAAHSFVGNVPAHFPSSLHQELVDRSWTLARLFQSLGYVGRCSFDMILVGDRLEDCRIDFVECNGRWGGTSLPMTLMNRLFGDWRQQPHALQVFPEIDGLSRFGFDQVLAHFQQDLFDARSGKGSLIFLNPGRLKTRSGITVIALEKTWDAAVDRLKKTAGRLVRLAASPIDETKTQPPGKE